MKWRTVFCTISLGPKRMPGISHILFHWLWVVLICKVYHFFHLLQRKKKIVNATITYQPQDFNAFRDVKMWENSLFLESMKYDNAERIMNGFILRIKWVNISKMFKGYTCYQIPYFFANHSNTLHREIISSKIYIFSCADWSQRALCR